MSTQEEAASAAEPTPVTQPDGGPGQLSRRSMLRGTASAGAAGLALTALAGPAFAASRPAPASHAGSRAAGRSGSAAAADQVTDQVADGADVVVHVRDVRSGDMDVYRGTSHVRVQDRDLAARLARAGH